MRNLNPAFNNPPTYELSITALEDVDVDITFGVPENIGLGLPYEAQSISIAAGELVSVPFGPGIFYQENPGTAQQLSFHVVSTGDIQITAYHNRWFFSEATSVTPNLWLGSEYMVLTEMDGGEWSQATIVATENQTQITVVPSVDLDEGPAGV
ncbi:MAG: hypothetical protein HRT74_03035, partial [Flavobacteriales bacterium]|nr:hypothetical protein [Flavobacteriales bacterium]